MKRGLIRSICSFSMLVLGWTPLASAQGAEPLLLYDNFKSRLIDPVKWRGAQLPGPFPTEMSRSIEGGRVQMSYRAYGGRDLDMGTTFDDSRLVVSDPSTITGIGAAVQVKTFSLTGCALNSAPTTVEARLGGFFFNTDSPPGEVAAHIGVFRDSASTDASTVLRARSYVIHCVDMPAGRTCMGLGGNDLGIMRRVRRQPS